MEFSSDISNLVLVDPFPKLKEGDRLDSFQLEENGFKRWSYDKDNPANQAGETHLYTNGFYNLNLSVLDNDIPIKGSMIDYSYKRKNILPDVMKKENPFIPEDKNILLGWTEKTFKDMDAKLKAYNDTQTLVLFKNKKYLFDKTKDGIYVFKDILSPNIQITGTDISHDDYICTNGVIRKIQKGPSEYNVVSSPVYN